MTAATHIRPFAIDMVAVAEASDDWGDIVDELSGIRPPHQSRTSRVADFIFRTDKSALTLDSLQKATRAHTSRLFGQAVSHHQSQGQQGEGHDEAMSHLLDAVRPGNGKAGDVFGRTKEFARSHRADVAILLASGSDELKNELSKALVKREMGRTRATQRAEAIYAALVAEFAAGNETERAEYFDRELDAIPSRESGPAGRLGLLKQLEQQLKQETGMSNRAMAVVAGKLSEMRGLIQQATKIHDKLISSATARVTLDTTGAELDKRLLELDAHLRAIESSTNLEPDTSDRLKAQIAKARTFLETLKARPQDLQELADHPGLQGALSALKDAQKYVDARRGLGYAADNVTPGLRTSLLARLDSQITDDRQAGLLADVGSGNPAIIDMLLPEAQWDNEAYALKSRALNPSSELAQINLDAQHELRLVAREMDDAMQSIARSGKSKAERVKLPASAFHALKAGDTLIAWFVKNTPRSIGQCDIAMANWIRLSLHDPNTGQPDSALRDQLFSRLRELGVDTQHMELHAAQGFRSSADVLACANQIRAFSAALAKSSAAARLDPQTRAAEVGLDLLEGLGIDVESISDHEAIDRQARELVHQSLKTGSYDSKLFRALRRIAILQVAVKSEDPKFTPSGRVPDAQTTYTSLIVKRMVAMGLDLKSNDDNMVEAKTQLLKKLPADTRTLAEICDAADPNSRTNRAKSGLKAAFGHKAPAQARAKPREDDDAPATVKPGTAQRRQVANERTFRESLAKLEANDTVTISFGSAVEVGGSTDVLPGMLSVGGGVRMETNNSVRVSRSKNDVFSVELLAGGRLREGASVAGVMDVLQVAIGTEQTWAKGHQHVFKQQSACETFLVTIARGGDVDAALRAAHSVEAASYSGRSADVSITAAADIKLAKLSAEVAAASGETRSVHETGNVRREVFTRTVSAEAVLRAKTAGNFRSAELGIGVDLGVRRTIVRKNEILEGGPVGSPAADLSPSLSMVAVVSFGNLRRCLDTLLPDADAEQRKSIEAQLGKLPDGTELFTRYRLTEKARTEANVLLGEADRLLRATRSSGSGEPAEVLEKVQQADAVMRNAANYTPDGFGWTVNSPAEVSGGLLNYARRDGEHTRFVEFDKLTNGGPLIGQSALLSILAPRT